MSYSTSNSSDDAPVAIGEGSGSNNISTVVVTKVDPKVKAKTMVFSKKNLTINTEPKVVVTVRGSGDEAPMVYNEDTNEARPSGDKAKTIYFNKLRNNDELTIDGQGEPLFMIDGKEAKEY